MTCTDIEQHLYLRKFSLFEMMQYSNGIPNVAF